MQTAKPDRVKNSYYELRPSEGKREGAFALKDISAGTRILSDQSLMTIKDLHSESEAQSAYDKLQGTDKTAFDAAPYIDPITGEKNYQASPIRKFNSNRFHVPLLGAYGCFVNASRFNHSCLPNCNMVTNAAGDMECYVFKDVKRGEELTFAYLDQLLYLPTVQRRALIRSNQLCGFHGCQCTLCSSPLAEKFESDLRRRLLRWLMYTFDSRLDIAPDTYVPIRKDRNTLIQIFGAGNFNLDGVMEPLRIFIDLAEREGIFGSRYLKYAHLWLAHALLKRATATEYARFDKEEEFELFKKSTLRAEELKVLSMGEARDPKDAKEVKFDAILIRAKDILSQMETLTSGSAMQSGEEQ